MSSLWNASHGTITKIKFNKAKSSIWILFEKISFLNEGWEPWFANKLPKTASNEIKDKCDLELFQKCRFYPEHGWLWPATFELSGTCSVLVNYGWNFEESWQIRMIIHEWISWGV